jgi:hypothetical protein
MFIPPHGLHETLAGYWRILLPTLVLIVGAAVGMVGWILGWWH